MCNQLDEFVLRYLRNILRGLPESKKESFEILDLLCCNGTRWITLGWWGLERPDYERMAANSLEGLLWAEGSTHTCQRKEAMTEGEDRGLRNEGMAKGHAFFSTVVFYLTTCVKTKSQKGKFGLSVIAGDTHF